MTASVQHVAEEGSRPDWSLVNRALFVRLRSIGDTVLMTPCLAALKSWRPDIEIAVVSEPLAAPILEDHPLVDELIIARPDLSSRARLISKLRRERFDIAFDMHGGTTATIISALSGARQTVGFSGYRYSFLLSRRAPAPDLLLGRSRVHSVEQQLALLRWAGVPWPEDGPRLSLKVSPDAEARARDRLSSALASLRGGALAPFACLAPSAAFESKRWPAGGFAEVSDHLRERWHLPSVVIAGPGQESVAREVARRSQNSGTPPIISGLSLKELIALLSLSDLFVGNDSGPMHIASALERPVVAVFGSSNADVWHPWSRSPYRLVKARAASIDSIPAADVIAAVDEVMRARAEAL